MKAEQAPTENCKNGIQHCFRSALEAILQSHLAPILVRFNRHTTATNRSSVCKYMSNQNWNPHSDFLSNTMHVSNQKILHWKIHGYENNISFRSSDNLNDIVCDTVTVSSQPTPIVKFHEHHNVHKFSAPLGNHRIMSPMSAVDTWLMKAEYNDREAWRRKYFADKPTRIVTKGSAISDQSQRNNAFDFQQPTNAQTRKRSPAHDSLSVDELENISLLSELSDMSDKYLEKVKTISKTMKQDANVLDETESKLDKQQPRLNEANKRLDKHLENSRCSCCGSVVMLVFVTVVWFGTYTVMRIFPKWY
jgi:hypothetical protein